MTRILLIEDNPQQRELYATLLYYNGFDVEQAATAESGMAAAKQRPPDLILIDYLLPGMDGLYATRQLKDSPVTSKIPVICFSAHDVPMGAIRSAGADAFLRKPISGDDLVHAIRPLIAADQPHGDVARSNQRAVIIASKESAKAADLMTSLRLEHFNVTRAGDGVTGIGMTSAVRPHVVLVDLHSPVLDGWSILKRLKQTADTAQIPLLAFSNSPNPEEAQRALAAGFAGYLEATDREHLLAALHQHVPASN